MMEILLTTDYADKTDNSFDRRHPRYPRLKS